MKYKTLGKTGLNVSKVSFGAIKLPNLTQLETDKIVHQAIDGGINYFDTANCYGDSETKLGKALSDGKRNNVIISSKTLKRTLSSYKKDFENTLRSIKTDYIDIQFIHDVSTEESWSSIQNNGILEYLERVKKDGAIRHIACSTHDVAIGEKMLKTGLFEVTMLAYNPSSNEVEPVLFPICKDNGIGTVIMKPFGGGVLTLEKSKKLGFEITAQDCYKYVLSSPYVDVVIPGLDSSEYVATALTMGDTDWELSNEERIAIQNKVTITGKNYCRGCGYCMPCPKGINIPTVVQLYNRWEVFQNMDWSQMHMIQAEFSEKTNADNSPSRCTACGACEKKCPFNLTIPSLMKEVTKTLG